jgi:hypothetical protein
MDFWRIDAITEQDNYGSEPNYLTDPIDAELSLEVHKDISYGHNRRKARNRWSGGGWASLLMDRVDGGLLES